MTAIRKFIYRIKLEMINQTSTEITLATHIKENIPMLIDKNKHWFEKPENKVMRWRIMDELNTFGLSPDQYEEEISYCDIVDEIV